MCRQERTAKKMTITGHTEAEKEQCSTFRNSSFLSQALQYLKGAKKNHAAFLRPKIQVTSCLTLVSQPSEESVKPS